MINFISFEHHSSFLLIYIKGGEGRLENISFNTYNKIYTVERPYYWKYNFVIQQWKHELGLS